MPEYLAPGVYMEETSYRAKSIEGVATSTTGFVGSCRFGPVQGPPVLVTSMEEYIRTFGGLEDLEFDNADQPATNHMAHAVKAFFENGGKRVYVARIFGLDATAEPADTAGAHAAVQADPAPPLGAGTGFTARFPGRAGNLRVQVSLARGSNVLTGSGAGRRLRGLAPGEIVQVRDDATPLSTVVGSGTGQDPLVPAELYWAERDDNGEIQLFNQPTTDGGRTALVIDAADDSGPHLVQKVTIRVEVGVGTRTDVHANLSTHPLAADFIGRVLRTEDPEEGVEPPYDRTARVWYRLTDTYSDASALALLAAMAGQATIDLTGGDDGEVPTSDEFAGGGSDHTATGLAALGEVDDIAIVAAPGSSALATSGATDAANALEHQAVREALLAHCATHRYRCAILSADRGLDTAGIRDIRAQHDSSYGALYYPWVVVRDPFGQPGDTLELPPDGFVAGIYARSDVERGVHKAPANEVVRGALRFNRPIATGVQDTLNPLGINCLRFMEGRGYRVWGARTMSSDPEWKYVNVRRLFIFLEHSIDLSTQWAVFEPNNEQLWKKVEMTIASFLTDVWKTGALMGTRPEEAFFVRCDRTTMTQGDLDNGRLVCLIGVAPTKPAEFVIFRIGQWTADASII